MRTVLLDALGTVVELEPPWPLLRAALAERGVEIGLDDARGALLEEIAYYRAHHHEAVDAAALHDLRERCTEVLRAALPARARQVDDLRGALLASLRFRAYPEAAEVLAALRADGVRLVVVSNWDVSLHEALATTGLAPLLDGAISSAEVRSAKPDGGIFAQALALAGDVAAEEALHVGDSLDADVTGAVAAGIPALLVARDGELAAAEAAARAVGALGAVADLRGVLAHAAPYRARSR